MNPPKTRFDPQSDTFFAAAPRHARADRAAAGGGADEIMLGMISKYMGILPRKD